MAAYPQFGYSYPSAGQLLAGSEQLTINPSASASTQSPLTATNPPSLSPGGSGNGTQPGALSPGSISQTSQNTGPLPVGGEGIMTSSSTCCENGRTVMTDPVTGQVICSCQYDSARLALSGYSRLPSSGVYGTSYPSSDQNPYPTISLDSSAFYSPLSNPYALKDNSGSSDMSAWTSAGLQSTSGYYSYDPALAAYGYGAGYDLASRRKNATRESTATLKAWLNEHKKNPYPTKGEKIMLAIITKMTLTQISTWFANARRRLKKEKKMTWEPKNKTDEDDDAMLSEDEKDKDDLDDKSRDRDDSMHRLKVDHEKCENSSNAMDKDRKQHGMPTQHQTGFQHHPYYQNSGSSLDTGYNQDQQYHNLKAIPKNPLESDCGVPVPKTKIWSLADTAACRTPPLNLPQNAIGWGYPNHYQHQQHHQQSHSPHPIQNNLSSTPTVDHHGMMNSSMFNANPSYTQYEELITRQTSTQHPFINTSINNTSPISPNSSSQSTTITEPILLMQHRQSLGFPEALQTETPPQTPPNMKSPTTRSLLTTTLQILTTDTMNNSMNGSFHNQQLDTPPTSQQQINMHQLHDATGIKSLYKNNNFVPPV